MLLEEERIKKARKEGRKNRNEEEMRRKGMFVDFYFSLLET
jgi:hypothetical protein